MPLLDTDPCACDSGQCRLSPAWVPVRPRLTGTSPGTGAQPRPCVPVSGALGPGEVAPGWGSGLKLEKEALLLSTSSGASRPRAAGREPEPTQSRAGGDLGHNEVPGTGQRGAPSSQTSTATHPNRGAGEPLAASCRPALPGIRCSRLVKAHPGPEPSHPPCELINRAGPGPLSPQVPVSQEGPRQQVAIDRGLPRLSAVPSRGVCSSRSFCDPGQVVAELFLLCF